jgi:predicted peroxiredoxin
MQKNHKVLFATAIVAGVLAGALLSYPGTLSTAQAQHDDHATTATSSSGYTPSAGKTIMVHITSGVATDSHQVHSAMMGVDHALAFYRSGKDVSIMLDVDGVRIAAKTVPDQLKPINENLKTFLDEGGRVIACNHCVLGAGLTPADLLDGVEIDSHPNMPRTQGILERASVVLDY